MNYIQQHTTVGPIIQQQGLHVSSGVNQILELFSTTSRNCMKGNKSVKTNLFSLYRTPYELHTTTYNSSNQCVQLFNDKVYMHNPESE